MSKRVLRAELDIARTLEKLMGLIDGDIDQRVLDIAEGDLSDRDYKGACGYVQGLRHAREFMLEAFTVEASTKDSVGES